MHELSLLVAGFFLGDLLYFFRAGRGVEAWFSRLANRRGLAVAIAIAVAALPRLLLLPWFPIPEPFIADEFSFILGAQTFAAGRMTNPVHPFWKHFETFHVNMLPTYQTQYQPAPSLFMALPVSLHLSPWWGVWLATGLMAGAICWALQPIIRPRYALLAALFVGIKYGLFSQYSDSYWGGSVCALGAALALGGLVRVLDKSRTRDVGWLVLGVALLASSRPWEGFMFDAPLALGFLAFVMTRRGVRVLVPATAMLIVVGLFLAYYNYRGTGRATEMPYVANFKQYHYVQPFFGMALLPVPHYDHQVMKTFFAQWEARPGLLAQYPKGIVKLETTKAAFYYDVHFAPVLLLALLGVWAAVRSRRRAWLVYTALFMLVALFAVVWWPLASYPAPLLVSYFGLVFLGLRMIRTLRLRNHPIGFYWARGFVVVLLFWVAAQAQETGRRQMKGDPNPHNGYNALLAHNCDHETSPSEWSCTDAVPYQIERQRIIHQLERAGGRHLVFVHYEPWHVYHQEWVYNTPNIDQQPVVLARMMGAQDDCKLVRYYGDRNVWFAMADRAPWAPLVPMSSPYAPFHC
jgi:hypothetical protein